MLKDNFSLHQDSRKYSKELVVCMYRENVLWIPYVPKNWNVTVYCKDPEYYAKNFEKLHGHCTFLSLPNYGRESQTIFHHLSSRYHRLAEMTMFVQGEPFEHTPHFFHLLHKDSLEEIADCHLRFFPQNKSIVDVDKGYLGIGGFWKYYSYSNSLSDFDKSCGVHYPPIWKWAFNNEKYPLEMRSTWGSQFLITKNRVKSFKEEFYHIMVDYHNIRKLPLSYNLPWALEHIMPELFLTDRTVFPRVTHA